MVASPSSTASIQFRSLDSQPSSICSSLASRVAFHHPAYNSTRLLELSAFDGPSGGIHHGTALLICGIVADDYRHGWLSETRGGEKINLGIDDLLTGKDYYFHLPSPAGTTDEIYKYPIFISFRHWRFPHNSSPFGWDYEAHLENPASFPAPSVSSMSQAVRDRDISCCLSNDQDAIERVHLCPRAEVDWFTQQEMDKYNSNNSLSGVRLVDDMANAVTLRQDIHTIFDSAMFVFIKRRDSWVSCFLGPTSNLGPRYHNVPVKLPLSVSPAFLLARLAWAIFPRIANFLSRDETRLVTLRDEASGRHETKEMSGSELRSTLGRSNTRGRSNSPPKRKRDDDVCQIPAVATDRPPKRACLSHAPASRSKGYSRSLPTLTPDYTEPGAFSNDSLLRSPESMEQDEDEENSEYRIAHLRRNALAIQRKVDPRLVCCDYDAAEEANLLELEGPRENGGAHLCLKCLGAEYADLEEFDERDSGNVEFEQQEERRFKE